MDFVIYRIAVCLTFYLMGFGVVYLARAVYGFATGSYLKDLPQSRLLVLSQLLRGISNLLIGITLFWHVNETTSSTILVLLTMSAYVMWDWFVQTYFIERIKTS